MATKVETFLYEGTKKKTEEQGRLRAVAYCRVSTLSDEQELSYESQCDYFRQMIEAREDLEVAGAYGNHGVSGLHMDKRPGLQQMLADAREEKFDVIFAKSISRMARNAIELQEILNEMKEHNITVLFEREALQSDDPQFEIVIKFLSAIAQEESNSTSQAIKWSHENNIKNGNPTQACSYGFRSSACGNNLLRESCCNSQTDIAVFVQHTRFSLRIVNNGLQRSRFKYG